MSKKPGRRRRNKKDVVLDFSKGKGKISKDSAAPILVKSDIPKNKKPKGKLTLGTSNKDYDGNLSIPEQVAQRDYETTGQFFKRLDRLVAKARVEASMESRFDMTLSKDPTKETNALDKKKRDAEDAFVEAKLAKHKRNKRKRGR